GWAGGGRCGKPARKIDADADRPRPRQPVAVGVFRPVPPGAGEGRRAIAPTVPFFGDDAYVVHLDRAVGAILGTQPATDAPVLDHDLVVVPAVDRTDRAADHAHRLEAGAARRRHQGVLEARPGQE